MNVLVYLALSKALADLRHCLLCQAAPPEVVSPEKGASDGSTLWLKVDDTVDLNTDSHLCLAYSLSIS